MYEIKKDYPKRLMKGGYTYYYYFKYYPLKYKVSTHYQRVRNLIWNFKDGLLGDSFHNDFANGFDDLNLSYPERSWWLCIIPASTEEKTKKRFKRFCEVYSREAGINNGYSLIVNKQDRGARHLREDRRSIDILDSIDFSNIRHKKILLFDDVYTTGKSFMTVAKRLNYFGAAEVVGLMLGKTHWIEDESETIPLPPLEDYGDQDIY